MNKFVIIETSKVSTVDFNQVLEDSADTLRYSFDGTKTFVNYKGDQPSFLEGKLEHTNAEILEILKGDEWAFSTASD